MTFRRLVIIAMLLGAGPAASAALAQAPAPADDPPTPAREQIPLGRTPDDADNRAEGSTGAGSPLASGLKVAAALGVVITLIVLLRVVLRRIGGFATTGGAGQLVDVIGRASIGPKTQIVLLKVNHRVIVAGQTPAGISTLASIEDPDEVAAVLAQVRSRGDHSISRSFQRLMRQFDRTGGDAEVAGSIAPADDEHTVDRARGQVSSLLDRLRRFRGGGE
jgi:flagellar biogenesis protein FliO